MGDAPKQKPRFKSAKQWGFTRYYTKQSTKNNGKKSIDKQIAKYTGSLVVLPTAIAANIVAAPIKKIGRSFTKTSRRLGYAEKAADDPTGKYATTDKLAKAAKAVKEKIKARISSGKNTSFYNSKLVDITKAHFGGEMGRWGTMSPAQKAAAIESLTGVEFKIANKNKTLIAK